MYRSTSSADMRLSSLMLRSAVDVVDLLRVLTASVLTADTDGVAASSTDAVTATELTDVTVTVWGTVLLALLTVWETTTS